MIRAHTKKIQRVFALFTICLVIWIIYFSPLHAAVVRHSSVIYKFVIWKDVSPDYIPETGDYVLYQWSGNDPNEVGLEDGLILTKRVGCTPGEDVRVDGSVFFCGDRYLGVAQIETPESRKRLIPFPFGEGSKVPPGHIFLIGDTAQSYDSRYVGFLSTKGLIGKVIIGF